MTEVPIASSAAPTQVRIVARDVAVERGGRTVLRDATFELAAGTVTAVIGPNGSGKSTLLHAIAGLLPLASGTLERPGLHDHGGRTGGDVAYVLQGAQVDEHLPISVREVVTMGRYGRRGHLGRLRDEDRALVDAALDRLEVSDLVDRQMRELSGGQRQRVLVAQGLAQDAPILLLDEPVTGLDVVSQRIILEVMAEERAAGRLVVATTHDLGDAAHADHVLLLSGRLVASGPPEEVLVADHLASAYGQRLIRLGENVLMLDDAPHHDDLQHDGPHHDHGPGHHH